MRNGTKYELRAIKDLGDEWALTKIGEGTDPLVCLLSSCLRLQGYSLEEMSGFLTKIYERTDQWFAFIPRLLR
jgi:hypothetical protein